MFSHCTGIGRRAMETLIEQDQFVAVFDFALGEVTNHLNGSVVSAGPSRLEGAGRRGVPRLVAPGASDMIDVQSWLPLPPRYAVRPYHAHNRLIGSVITTEDERRELARTIAAKLATSKGPTALLLPRHGVHEWDRPDQPLHAPQAHAAYMDEFRRCVRIQLSCTIWTCTSTMIPLSTPHWPSLIAGWRKGKFRLGSEKGRSGRYCQPPEDERIRIAVVGVSI